MSLRARVDTIRRATVSGRPHQGLRLSLADALAPAVIGDAARGILTRPRAYTERVNREAARLFPALHAWSDALAALRWPSDGVEDDSVDWEADAWHLMPVPEPSAAVLQEADRAVRAAGTPAADELERDALIVSAYTGHVALNLARSMRDLEAEADRLGI